MEFFFISGFKAGNPVEVGRDTFAPYTGDLGNLCLEGIPPPPFLFLFFSFVYERLTFLFFSFFFFLFFFFFIAVG